MIYVAPIGRVDEDVLAAAEAGLVEAFGFRTRRLAPAGEPAYAWDPVRRQYSGSLILRELALRRPPDAARLLAMTELDLFIPMLTFVFGQAQLSGSLAIVSLARLRQEFHGLPPNPELLRARALKEVLHEMGHTFGLLHCPSRDCTMSLSTAIRQLDAKGAGYCPGCSALVAENLRNLRVQI